MGDFIEVQFQQQISVVQRLLAHLDIVLKRDSVVRTILLGRISKRNAHPSLLLSSRTVTNRRTSALEIKISSGDIRYTLCIAPRHLRHRLNEKVTNLSTYGNQHFKTNHKSRFGLKRSIWFNDRQDGLFSGKVQVTVPSPS